jgi:arylsulfatase A-like enzyme
MNALEKLVNGSGYRLAINDFTIAEHLRPDTPKVTIDPGVPSVETDLCQNLDSLQAYLDGSSGDPRPVFGYLAPMNLHILNTRRGGQTAVDGEYPGFYAPYASRLRRVDACFGRFVTYLKARGRYENSIIVLTSDHGDSLGEDGHWGHGTWLYPEDIRVPLIVRVPDDLRPAVTTDLARIAFSTDIAPTLYALTGRPVRDLGPLFGAPLFVPAGETLPDRRRESYLLTSSYGATFALLRRNGRFLYVSDLVDWRESAFDLSAAPLGTPVVVDSGLRRVNQLRIRELVAEVTALYEGTR